MKVDEESYLELNEDIGFATQSWKNPEYLKS
jgi:hypothetical protein